MRSAGVQTFTGGGPDALALSSSMREAWTSFARTGVPGTSPSGDGSVAWPAGDPVRRPTVVLGRWPGSDGLVHRVDDPRGPELDVVAAVAGDRPGLHWT